MVARRFLQARKFNPADALEQYREARAFHAEKGILHLYDSIGVDDYEATRRLVSPSFSPSFPPFQYEVLRTNRDNGSTPTGPAVEQKQASQS